MSLMWTAVAGFLYLEVFIVLTLVLPVASPQRWSRLFRSKFFKGIQTQAGFYFMLILAILVMFLLDAIREMRKYSNTETDGEHKHLDAEMQSNMRLFRAQRNFYISGFSLFLALVIRRLVSLILSQAGLMAQSEAALKQAESATTTARSLISKNEKSTNDTNDEVDELKARIKELEGELKVEITDKLAVKSQAENLSKEYDRLAEEHSKIQKKVTTEGGALGDKKDD